MARTQGKTLITIELSEILLTDFDTIISKRGLNRSEVIRNIISEYIDKNREWYLK